MDFEPDDSNVDADAGPELDDLVDLTKVVGTEDREVVVAGIDYPLHMDFDNMAPKMEFMKVGELPRLNIIILFFLGISKGLALNVMPTRGTLDSPTFEAALDAFSNFHKVIET